MEGISFWEMQCNGDWMLYEWFDTIKEAYENENLFHTSAEIYKTLLFLTGMAMCLALT